MEDKKSNKSLLVIVIAILLIGVGVVLILTGNNKSFLVDDKSNSNTNENKENQDGQNNQEPIDESQRNIIPQSISQEEIVSIILQKKNEDFSEETWYIGAVYTVAHDENNEKYLVKYEEVEEDGTIRNLLTIVTVLGNEKYVEMPGWEEGERDLTVYNFIYENYDGHIDDFELAESEVPDEQVEQNETVEPTESENSIE